MAHKRTWYVKLFPYLSQSVLWGCRETSSEGEPETRPWARYVRIVTELDGRDVVLWLTPNEARGLASALYGKANQVDQMNAVHGNGGEYPNEADWA